MRREIAFRYRLLRDGGFCAWLQASENRDPTIRMDTGAEIKMSFTADFLPEALDADGNAVEINWFSDEIQPVLILDGVEHNLGVFMPATPKDSDDGVSRRVGVEAYDRCWRVRDTNSAGLLYWPAGTLYLDAVEQLLVEAGIGIVIKTPTDAVFAEAREDWDVGTSYLTVVNQLLGEINYNPLWFNAEGAAILEPVSVPDASAIDHILDASDPETCVLPGISRETDVYSAPNVFIAICANPDKEGLMAATAKNENPQSPLSVQRRGRQICQVTQVDNIADQDALQAYADKLRDDSVITGETVRVATALLPGWGVADVVGLCYGEVTALCIERAFEMQLAVGGKMTHTLEKVVYQLD